MDNTVVNRSPRKNSINIDRGIIIDRNIDSDSNVISNIERDRHISNRPWYIRLLGISSLILTIIFMSVGITTFVMALTMQHKQYTDNDYINLCVFGIWMS